jgi:predicted amidophosphoribosyltransferase
MFATPDKRDEHPRIKRERRTVAAMIALYCRDHHRSEDALCSECSELLAYADERLDRCPFGERKTTCAKCPVHCYRPAMREKIRAVMRYAGPRMLLRHPLLAIRHLIDSSKEPVRTPVDKR